MGQDLLAAVRKLYNAAQNQTGTISLAKLRKVVAEELKAAANAPQDTRSWAAVASQESSHIQTQTTTPAKTVPARINNEILIRGRGMPADKAKRTPQEIVQARQITVTRRTEGSDCTPFLALPMEVGYHWDLFRSWCWCQVWCQPAAMCSAIRLGVHFGVAAVELMMILVVIHSHTSPYVM
jgi:hypothetical protein